ncbi:hypothetical protein H311_00907 [Anncaliia algerae PRA109]|nr:hypothetical protein H311_02242 [Anncaliia algerae PRA109]KCZ78071.1 hypothetical protein H311_00907 [Anncaliia algerae PRA109]
MKDCVSNIIYILFYIIIFRTKYYFITKQSLLFLKQDILNNKVFNQKIIFIIEYNNTMEIAVKSIVIITISITLFITFFPFKLGVLKLPSKKESAAAKGEVNADNRLLSLDSKLQLLDKILSKK